MECESSTSKILSLPSSDCSLRSANGMVFNVHRNKLTANSEIFEGMFALSHDDGEPIQLTENAEVLEGLLRFFYVDLYPPADDWSMEHLTDIAECAYKYAVVLICDVVHRILLTRHVARNG